MRKQQAHQAPVRQARKRSKWPRVAFFSSQALLPKDMDVPSTKPGLGGRFLGGASSPLGMEVEAWSEQVKVGAAFGGLSQESESDRMVLNAAQDLWQVWVESPVDVPCLYRRELSNPPRNCPGACRDGMRIRSHSHS